MTQHFDVSEEDRLLLVPCHRAFQATVGQRANEALGLDYPVQGTGLYQGGLTVNGKPLVINPNNVSQYRLSSSDPTPEEIAVATAITRVVADFKRLGRKALIEPPSTGLQDPLRWFFEGPGGTKGIKLQ